MINISFVKINDKIKKVVIKGHANSTKKDEYDLVCASVSVFSQGVINAMIKVLEGRQNFFSLDENGEIVLNYPKGIDTLQEIKIDTLFDMLEINLKILSVQYYKYITFEIKEV